MNLRTARRCSHASPTRDGCRLRSDVPSDRRGGDGYGTVSVRFIIGRDGGVSNTSLNAWTMNSGTYVECVETAFAGMLFPKPAGGVVTVVYSLVAKPG